MITKDIYCLCRWKQNIGCSLQVKLIVVLLFVFLIYLDTSEVGFGEKFPILCKVTRCKSMSNQAWSSIWPIWARISHFQILVVKGLWLSPVTDLAEEYRQSCQPSGFCRVAPENYRCSKLVHGIVVMYFGSLLFDLWRGFFLFSMIVLGNNLSCCFLRLECGYEQGTLLAAIWWAPCSVVLGRDDHLVGLAMCCWDVEGLRSLWCEIPASCCLSHLLLCFYSLPSIVSACVS